MLVTITITDESTSSGIALLFSVNETNITIPQLVAGLVRIWRWRRHAQLAHTAERVPSVGVRVSDRMISVHNVLRCARSRCGDVLLERALGMWGMEITLRIRSYKRFPPLRSFYCPPPFFHLRPTTHPLVSYHCGHNQRNLG